MEFFHYLRPKVHFKTCIYAYFKIKCKYACIICSHFLGLIFMFRGWTVLGLISWGFVSTSAHWGQSWTLTASLRDFFLYRRELTGAILCMSEDADPNRKWADWEHSSQPNTTSASAVVIAGSTGPVESHTWVQCEEGLFSHWRFTFLAFVLFSVSKVCVCGGLMITFCYPLQHPSQDSAWDSLLKAHGSILSFTSGTCCSSELLASSNVWLLCRLICIKSERVSVAHTAAICGCGSVGTGGWALFTEEAAFEQGPQKSLGIPASIGDWAHSPCPSHLNTSSWPWSCWGQLFSCLVHAWWLLHSVQSTGSTFLHVNPIPAPSGCAVFLDTGSD